MKTLLCFTVLVFAVAFVTGLKRFRRDFQQRDLFEAAHAVKDVDGLQSILEEASDCAKSEYVKELKEELNGIKRILRRLRGLDWFSEGFNWDLNEEEMELFGAFAKLYTILPETYDMETGEHKDLGQFVTKCEEQCEKEDLGLQPDCSAAKNRLMDLITQCEDIGFDQAIKTLDSADTNDAKNLAEGMQKILEILAEVRDLNYYALGVAYTKCDNYQSTDSFNDIKEDAGDNVGPALNVVFGAEDDVKKSITSSIKSSNIGRHLSTKVNSNMTGNRAKIQSLLRSILKKY